MYAECNSGGQAAGGEELPYNEDFIVIHTVPVVRDWILLRGKKGGCSAPVYHAPQDEFEWIALLKRADVNVVGVRSRCEAGSCLVRVAVPGTGPQWVCTIDPCQSERGRCRSLCRHYCEVLLRDCAILGDGRPEVFPGTTLAEMRRRIADAVADELC